MTAATLAQRYAQVLSTAWRARAELTPARREPLERQFLPATLEIIETPAPALAHGLIWSIVAIVAAILTWSWFGHVDMMAVAPGKIISADKSKVIQPAETAVVKRIHVRDGQAVKAGDILLELEAAATATAAESLRLRDALFATRLESARFDALARAATGTATNATLIHQTREEGDRRIVIEAEQRALTSQYQEHRTRLATVDAEIRKRQAELASAQELANKLSQTAPIAKRRAEVNRPGF